jgi:hypothetical protein
MTGPRLLSVAVILLMMAAFVWGRFRYDLCAAWALLLSLALGVDPYEETLSGFRRLGSGGQRRRRALGRDGSRAAALCAEREGRPNAAASARRRGDHPLRIREEHRRVGDHDPDRVSVCSAVRGPGVCLSPADGIWIAPGRPYDPGRDLAKHRSLAHSGGTDRRELPDVPVSDSLRRSGASDALAGWLADVGSPPPAHWS